MRVNRACTREIYMGYIFVNVSFMIFVARRFDLGAVAMTDKWPYLERLFSTNCSVSVYSSWGLGP